MVNGRRVFEYQGLDNVADLKLILIGISLSMSHMK